MRFLYAILVIVGLVIMGEYSPKIALTLAALIFLGALIVNKENFSNLMNGGALR